MGTTAGRGERARLHGGLRGSGLAGRTAAREPLVAATHRASRSGSSSCTWVRRRSGTRSEPAPLPQTRAWLTRPWAELRGGEGGPSSSGVIEARVVAVGGLLLVAALAGFGQRLMEVEGALSARAQSIAELKQSTAQVIAARDQALSQAATARLFASWLTEPLPIEVVAHLHDVLGKSGAQIKELELTGSRLRLGMAVPAPASRSNIVRDLQSGSWLKDVSEVKTDSARGLVVMDMRLDGSRAPPLRSTVTAAAPPLPAPADASKARVQESAAAAAVKPPAPVVPAVPAVPAAPSGPRAPAATAPSAGSAAPPPASDGGPPAGSRGGPPRRTRTTPGADAAPPSPQSPEQPSSPSLNSPAADAAVPSPTTARRQRPGAPGGSQ